MQRASSLAQDILNTVSFNGLLPVNGSVEFEEAAYWQAEKKLGSPAVLEHKGKVEQGGQGMGVERAGRRGWWGLLTAGTLHSVPRSQGSMKKCRHRGWGGGLAKNKMLAPFGKPAVLEAAAACWGGKRGRGAAGIAKWLLPLPLATDWL